MADRRKTDRQLDAMRAEDIEAYIHELEAEHDDLRAYRIRARRALDRVLTGAAGDLPDAPDDEAGPSGDEEG